MKNKITKKSSQTRVILSKKSKEPLLKKGIRNNLEEKVRQQTDELKIRDGQLKQGADRENKGLIGKSKGLIGKSKGLIGKSKGLIERRLQKNKYIFEPRRWNPHLMAFLLSMPRSLISLLSMPIRLFIILPDIQRMRSLERIIFYFMG